MKVSNENYKNVSGGEFFEIGSFYNNRQERFSPFRFDTPRTYKSHQLLKIGIDGAKKIESLNEGRDTHIIAVENKGIPIATSIAIALNGKKFDCMISISNKISSLPNLIKDEDFIVVVDNSIITGKTITKALEDIVRINGTPNLVLHLFDYCHIDSKGNDVCRDLEIKFSTKVESIYSVTNFYEAIPDNKKPDFKDYFIKYGNRNIKDILGI